jgi:methylase of polypeptide subunit release factors
VALKSIAGSLASGDLLEQLAVHDGGTTALRRALADARRTLGPASSARQIFDLQLQPLLRTLRLDATVVRSDPLELVACVSREGTTFAVLSAGAWGGDLRRLRDRAARGGPHGARWWIGGNGAVARLMDVSRAYTHRALEFDLARLEDDELGLMVLQRLFDAEPGAPLITLEGIVTASDRHNAAVGRSLQAGVEEALARLVQAFSRRQRRTPGADNGYADALTVVYRILFLLFAEARGLVPQWHPIYRRSYTIESLREVAEARASPAGLWQSLQAISRLAHRGCTAGTLRVVPFNGRLFAPAAAPLADSFVLDDRVARDVLLAVTTRPAKDRRERISYLDLGVEQLGAVYERVLDNMPGDVRRRASGTFYTPRAITEYLVRRTLAPLVRGRRPAEILSLRILDPAMGSGAFLVAACRYLADAYEESSIEYGTLSRADITAADRASFRRGIAQRCLYGVDVNPTAVQLARLSLWLCTLAADRPLSFLDHHLRTGNSLAGADAADLARQPPGRGRGRSSALLPLFDTRDLDAGVATSIEIRGELAGAPDDSAEAVRRKERAMDALAGSHGPLAAWRALADAWCAAWFWPAGTRPMTPRAWSAFSAALRGVPSGLPEAFEREWRTTAAQVAATERFFHWQLEFPEIFFDDGGQPLASAGFDAVIGNPPWADARAVAAFSRESGCYALQGGGHVNLYQLFAERMLRLTKPGGRTGMLMPSGLLADHGCAALRRQLFERCDVDAVLGFDNREGLFPIHRALRFFLITATAGGSTRELQLRCGLRSAAVLEDVPDRGRIPNAIEVSLPLIRRFSGDGMAVPELEHERDRAILARVVASAPPLGDEDGWKARFGRELNATDDRGHFTGAGLPVLEGKLLDPYQVRTREAVSFIEAGTARTLLGERARFDRPRLGYREVASSTNRLTLIAAIIPPGHVTTHTIFCLRTPEDEALHWFLCGVFNSFPANYLVRLRGGTHVPAASIHQLPLPVVSRDSATFVQIASLARVAHDDETARAEVHGRSALAYRLDEADFVHVLGTFPLVAERERQAALDAFRRVRDEI